MSAVAVHSIVTGRADGPPVVLSNSLGSTYRMWDPQLVALEARFRVIRYDARGHGGSPVLIGPSSIDDLADDLIALLDRLGVERAHLVGLSLGGMITMRVAARDPGRVDRIALLCTGACMPPPARWHERAALVRAKGSEAVAPSVVERWFTPSYLATHPAHRTAYEDMIASTPAEGYAGCCEAIAETDLRGELALIEAPALVVAGVEDPAAPPSMLEEVAAGVRRSQLLVVPSAAHLANVEQPDTITAALITHLERS